MSLGLEGEQTYEVGLIMLMKDIFIEKFPVCGTIKISVCVCVLVGSRVCEGWWARMTGPGWQYIKELLICYVVL